jgi:myo-inositol 2-dehydrogenase/D-chiro-inositol 1-dehydrogenase
MDTKTVKYAIVGLNLGLDHIKPILKNPRADLLGCFDLDDEKLEKARNLVEEHGGSREKTIFTNNYEELLSNDEINAILIALPTKLHAEFSIKAMLAGKHVFCEKPLSESLEKAREIRETVKKTGKVFQLGYCVRSSPFHKKCMEIMQSGTIGQVTNLYWNMYSYCPFTDWRADRKQRGGKLFDCACHYLDLLSIWAGAKPFRLCAFGAPLGEKGKDSDKIPEVASVMIEFENGVKASYNLSQVSRNAQNSTCGIAASNGKIEADPFFPEKAGSMTVHSEGGLYKSTIVINGEKTSRGHLGFTEQHDPFIDAINKGTPPACGIDEGIEIDRLMSAIDKSIAEGRVVHLEEIV